MAEHQRCTEICLIFSIFPALCTLREHLAVSLRHLDHFSLHVRWHLDWWLSILVIVGLALFWKVNSNKSDFPLRIKFYKIIKNIRKKQYLCINLSIYFVAFVLVQLPVQMTRFSMHWCDHLWMEWKHGDEHKAGIQLVAFVDRFFELNLKKIQKKIIWNDKKN